MGSTMGDADPDVILTPNDIMSFIDPVSRPSWLDPIGILWIVNLIDYEDRRGFI